MFIALEFVISDIMVSIFVRLIKHFSGVRDEEYLYYYFFGLKLIFLKKEKYLQVCYEKYISFFRL